MTVELDPFYLIVDGADSIERLVPLGVKLVQLRVKGSNRAWLRREIRRARDLCHAFGCRLIVNDYWRTAIEEGCDCVHLGQEDLRSADLRAIRGSGLRLGISTHDHDELETALDAGADYVALGPIYPTLLKKMPWSPQGIGRIREWKSRIGDLPLVAIGGLTPERLDAVFAAGADSAAVVTDIRQSAEPLSRTREWLEKTDRWRIRDPLGAKAARALPDGR